MIVGGLDPGLHGAVAVVQDAKLVYCEHFESVEGKTRGRELIMSQVHHVIGCAALYGPEIMYVERVQAMPRQGASSGFKFGVTYGAALMSCTSHQLPIEPAEPRLWMKLWNLNSRDDDGTIRTACRLFPERVEWFTPVRGRLTKDTCAGRADAALIALWGYRLSTRGGMGDEGQ